MKEFLTVKRNSIPPTGGGGGGGGEDSQMKGVGVL